MPERPSWTPAPLSPDVVRSFRQQLTVGEDVVDVTKWFPESYGIPPHVRVGRNRWFNLLWLLPIGFVFPDRGAGVGAAHEPPASPMVMGMVSGMSPWPKLVVRVELGAARSARALADVGFACHFELQRTPPTIKVMEQCRGESFPDSRRQPV